MTEVSQKQAVTRHPFQAYSRKGAKGLTNAFCDCVLLGGARAVGARTEVGGSEEVRLGASQMTMVWVRRPEQSKGWMGAVVLLK